MPKSKTESPFGKGPATTEYERAELQPRTQRGSDYWNQIRDKNVHQDAARRYDSATKRRQQKTDLKYAAIRKREKQKKRNQKVMRETLPLAPPGDDLTRRGNRTRDPVTGRWR